MHVTTRASTPTLQPCTPFFTAQVIVIDEIGTSEECGAARTIAQRGVQLVATAHGNELENVIKNPALADLVRGLVGGGWWGVVVECVLENRCSVDALWLCAVRHILRCLHPRQLASVVLLPYLYSACEEAVTQLLSPHCTLIGSVD